MRPPDPVAAGEGRGAAGVGAGAPPEDPDLEIFLARTCPTCPAAEQTVGRIARLRPDRRIMVTWVDDGGPGTQRADRAGIPGTPTYRIRGRTAFLGNPEEDELLAALDERTPR